MARRNVHGREFTHGKALSLDFRQIVIKELESEGAVHPNLSLPRGLAGKVGIKFSISRTSVRNLWIRYCKAGLIERKPHSGGDCSKVTVEDIEYIESLKLEKPSIKLKEIREKLLEHSQLNSISIAQISD